MKKSGNDTNRFDDEIVAIIDEFSEEECITKTQPKKKVTNF